jgi:hypothetical protein
MKNNSNENFKDALSKDLEKTSTPSLFQIKPANDWIDEAKKRPIPKMLFGSLWFEGELCILFADTNLGKSILAVQIAHSISSGISTCGMQLEAIQQPVIYIDFELSDKQFECRYSDGYEDHFIFNNIFFRAEIETASKIPAKFKSFDEYLYESIENAVVQHSSKILIIDNITYLRNGTEKANEAVLLMHFLNDLKKKYNLSILALAHTPKRDFTKPITKNDLSGSKTLINFCDSSFAIGENFNIKGVRYLKQIKQRFVENIYGTDNVITCEIFKDINFLKFKFIDFENELNHLKEKTIQNVTDRNEEIIKLKAEGLSNDAIAKRFGLTEGGIRSILKKVNS